MMRHFAKSVALAMAFCGSWTLAEGLPYAKNLKVDAHEAAHERMPILVFFMSDSCPYCLEVEDLYLRPMYERGTYRGQLLIRAVDVGSARPLHDFVGERTDHETFAHDKGVYLTPIIRFYDPSGKELVPDLVGYTSPDFYAGFLEKAIADSIATLRARAVATGPSRP